MSLPRFFIEKELPEADKVLLPLSEKEIRHVMVRRINEGEHIALVAPSSKSYEVEICAIDGNDLYARVITVLPPIELPHLTLVQGISKGDRMVQTVRQTTELGVERIIPFSSERSIVRISSKDLAHKGERWRRIAESAAKQSGRDSLPDVDDPMTIRDLCTVLEDYDRVVIAWEEADVASDGNPLSISDALDGCNMNSKVALIIGPEGGLSSKEIETFKTLGKDIKLVTLGELILRTETAAVVGCTLCMYMLGGLGNHGVIHQ